MHAEGLSLKITQQKKKKKSHATLAKKQQLYITSAVGSNPKLLSIYVHIFNI